MAIEEYAVINPRRKRGRPKKRRKTTTRRRSRRNPKTRTVYKTKYRNRTRTKYRTRRAPKRRTARRRPAVAVAVNPIERDIVKTLKDGALMTAGAVGAYALADYAAQKIDYIAENAEIAKPITMIVGGLGLGMVLKGKNKRLATIAGFGAVTAGLLTAVIPYIRDKVPGLPETATPGVATAMMEPVAPMGAYERTGVGGYYRDPSLSGLGAGMDPFIADMDAYNGMNGVH